MDKIIEGNKLIAEFDGWDKTNHIDEAFGNLYIKDGESAYANDFIYELSWEWLMPVLEKINTLKYPYLISHKTCSIYKVWQQEFISHEHGKTTIEATWNAVIQFIEWYNKNKK